MTKSILTNFWLWLGLLILLVVLVVARVPAHWAAYAFTQSVPGLTLNELQGTLWRGRAGSALLQVDNDVYSLGTFTWDISPLSLVTFSPCADISLAYQTQNAEGHVCASGSDIKLEDFSASVPAALLDIWFAVSLGGDIDINVQTGQFSGQSITALDGTMAWRNGAYFGGIEWINVGSFGADLIGDNRGGVNIDLNDLGGPILAELDVNYNKVLRPNDQIGVDIQGEVGIRDSAHPDLKTYFPTMVQAIGEATERGYFVEWSQ